jgi:hypothetical protein
VLRFYGGAHGYNFSSTNYGVTSASSGNTIYKRNPLILNDGSSVSHIDMITSSGTTNSTFFPLYKDQAMEFTTSIVLKDASIQFFSDFSINVKGATTSSPVVYTTERDGGQMYFTDHGTPCMLYNYSSAVNYSTFASDLPYMLVKHTGSGHSSSVFQLTHVSNGGIHHVGWVMCQNSSNKSLQSTTPITSDPITYTNLINNVGIYLANYSSENWICFQGDGELEVTVVGNAPDTCTVAVVGGSSGTISSDPQTVTIPAANLTQEGEVYTVNLKLRNVAIKTATRAATTGSVKSLQSTQKEQIWLDLTPIKGVEAEWIERSSGVTRDLHPCMFSDGIFIAGGGGGTLITSPDGITWTKRTSGVTSRIFGLAYKNGVCLFVEDYPFAIW